MEHNRKMSRLNYADAFLSVRKFREKDLDFVN